MDNSLLQDDIFAPSDIESELKSVAAQARKDRVQTCGDGQPLSVRAKRLHEMYVALDKTKHDMTLVDKPFAQIRDGVKTVEVRLLDEKRQKVKVGDIIRFTRKDTDEVVFAEVTALYRYETFMGLFSSEHFAKTGFVGLSPSAAAHKMYDYYDKADEQRYGVLGIEIKVVAKEK